VPLEALGPDVPTESLRPALMPLTRVEDGRLEAEVLWVDHFGNAQLNVDPAEIAGFGDVVEVTIGDRTRIARRVDAFESLGTGEVGLLEDSYGLVAVVADRASAAAELGLDAGAAVTLGPVQDGGADRRTGVVAAVSLRPRPTS
jgi:hypothetical protein